MVEQVFSHKQYVRVERRHFHPRGRRRESVEQRRIAEQRPMMKVQAMWGIYLMFFCKILLSVCTQNSTSSRVVIVGSLTQRLLLHARINTSIDDRKPALPPCSID